MNDLSSRQPTQSGLNAPLHPTDSLSNSDAGSVNHLGGISQTYHDGSSPSEAISVERIRLNVTDQDFHCSDQNGIRNPILCALQRETGTLWRIYDDGFALEAMAPFRACQLPPETMTQWHQWLVTGEMGSPVWDIELVDTHEKDGYSLIQHRQTNLREKCSHRHETDQIG